ncbi:hypothetical protein IWQ57_000954 [Coemansia nantahalensis]|uniref:Uncharacterized protein n=1 Tax=Coemansia nantahalensis TaxID=2789366 RepID=A0ACC1K5T2_9FUNG|nr:hypothetical protein IWQ57_000954 [Coemansia nantahalensis]
MAEKGDRRSLFSLRHHDRGARLPNAVAWFTKSRASGPRLARSASTIGAGRSNARSDTEALRTLACADQDPRGMQWRSIPAFAQMLSKRASFLHLGGERSAAEAPPPEAPTRHVAVLRRAISARWERLTKDSGECSARDSDDTLTAKAKVAASETGSSVEAPTVAAGKAANSAGSSLRSVRSDVTEVRADSDAEPAEVRVVGQRIQFADTDTDADSDADAPAPAPADAGSDAGSDAPTPADSDTDVDAEVDAGATPGAQGGDVAAAAAAVAGPPVEAEAEAETDLEPQSAGSEAHQPELGQAVHMEARTDSGAPETVHAVGGCQLLPADPGATVPAGPRQQRKLNLRRRWTNTDNRSSSCYAAMTTVRSTFAGLAATMDRRDGGRGRAGSLSTQSSSSSTATPAPAPAGATLTVGTSRILRARHSIIGTETVQRLLTSLGHISSGGGDADGSQGCAEAPPGQSARRSMQSHGRLSLVPHPSEVERARMDAWVDDDDEFLPGDYDLSGAYYVLALKAASAGVSDTAYGGVPQPEPQAPPRQQPQPQQRQQQEPTLMQDGSKCRTPDSRMSSTSTSTVVEGGALDPEQCRQIFLSSARKLRWSGRRREMSAVIHIRNTMVRANEQFAAASGGRLLDPWREARRLAADMCVYGGTAPAIERQQRDGIMVPEAAAPERPAVSKPAHAGGQFPARTRSIECLPQLLRMARQAADKRDDGSEPVYDSAHWAGAGDLVPLDAGGRERAAYRPYPRRRGSRRSSACAGSAFAPAGVVAAQ